MAEVSYGFEARWRFGAHSTTPPAHVGSAKPYIRVALRRGQFFRDYYPWDDQDDFAVIPGSSSAHPWQATWTPSEAYEDIPGVLQVDLNQSFDNNGLTTMTLQIDNIVYVQGNGLAGLFRTIERGYLSPWRGYSSDSSHFPEGPAGAANEWFEKLNRNVQITVWAGYGEDVAVPIWTGLVDDLDMTSKPDQITVTARDFGQVLTDQRCFGYVKDKRLKDPVIFADRHSAENTEKVGGAPRASSSYRGRPPSAALDASSGTAWISEGHNAGNVTEWFEIHIPHGRYEDFYLDAGFAGMEVYVSVYARNKDIQNRSEYIDGDGVHHKNPPKLNGQPIATGWVDTGLGTVPGALGGIPYIKKLGATTIANQWVTIPKVEVGTNSVIRLSFRNLHKWSATHKYHAAVKKMRAVKRTTKPQAKTHRWILVDDVTDVVKVILRWAGFKEWEIESAGVRLKENFVVNRASFLIDPINTIKEQLGYVFFIGDPSLADSSIGVPIFRSNGALQTQGDTRTVHDTDLLTGVNVKLTEDPLSTVIYVRGKQQSKKKGGTVVSPGEPPRVGADYNPPWQARMGNVIKHALHYDANLKTKLECLMGCYLIALAEAMKSATATIEIPSNPGIQLDDQIALKDQGTGMATRLYIATRSQVFRTGQDGSWKMTLGGSLLDTPDIQGVLADIARVDWSNDSQSIPVQLVNGSGPGIFGGAAQGEGPGMNG